jgi:hypothetical protein
MNLHGFTWICIHVYLFVWNELICMHGPGDYGKNHIQSQSPTYFIVSYRTAVGPECKQYASPDIGIACHRHSWLSASNRLSLHRHRRPTPTFHRPSASPAIATSCPRLPSASPGIAKSPNRHSSVLLAIQPCWPSWPEPLRLVLLLPWFHWFFSSHGTGNIAPASPDIVPSPSIATATIAIYRHRLQSASIAIVHVRHRHPSCSYRHRRASPPTAYVNHRVRRHRHVDSNDLHRVSSRLMRSPSASPRIGSDRAMLTLMCTM